MTPEDLDQLCSVEAALFPSPWSRQLFLDEMQRDCGRLLGLFEGDSLAAYAVFWTLLPEIHLLNIGVAPGHQRKGLARYLIRAMFAATPKAEVMLLEVRASNQAARGLYEGLGGQVTGVRVRYYQNPVEDAVLMELAADFRGNPRDTKKG